MVPKPDPHHCPSAQKPPPTHRLPRRGYSSQPGFAASAATPGQTHPRLTSTLKGLFPLRYSKTVWITGSSPGVRSNPYRIEAVFYGRLTWGSRSCGNPRLREVSPLGNFAAACGVTSQGPIAGVRGLWALAVAEWDVHAGPRRAMGRRSSHSETRQTGSSSPRRGIGFQPVSQNPSPRPKDLRQPRPVTASPPTHLRPARTLIPVDLLAQAI